MGATPVVHAHVNGGVKVHVADAIDDQVNLNVNAYVNVDGGRAYSQVIAGR